MTEKQTLKLYEKTGALLRGHFRLTSGLHSDVYLQSALVLQHPEHAAALGAALAAPFRSTGATTVLAPAIGGILVAHEVAHALGARALFTERENDAMALRRGFTLTAGGGRASLRAPHRPPGAPTPGGGGRATASRRGPGGR